MLSVAELIVCSRCYRPSIVYTTVHGTWHWDFHTSSSSTFNGQLQRNFRPCRKPSIRQCRYERLPRNGVDAWTPGCGAESSQNNCTFFLKMELKKMPPLAHAWNDANPGKLKTCAAPGHCIRDRATSAVG